jgi:hypothetical protein
VAPARHLHGLAHGTKAGQAGDGDASDTTQHGSSLRRLSHNMVAKKAGKAHLWA